MVESSSLRRLALVAAAFSLLLAGCSAGSTAGESIAPGSAAAPAASASPPLDDTVNETCSDLLSPASGASELDTFSRISNARFAVAAGALFGSDVVDPLASRLTDEDCVLWHEDNDSLDVFYLLIAHGMGLPEIGEVSTQMGLDLEFDVGTQLTYGRDGKPTLAVRHAGPSVEETGIPGALVLALFSRTGVIPLPDETKADWGSIDGTWCSSSFTTDCVTITDQVDTTWGSPIELLSVHGGCYVGSEESANVLFCPAAVPTPGLDFTPRMGAVLGDNPAFDRIWIYNGQGPDTYFRQDDIADAVG